MSTPKILRDKMPAEALSAENGNDRTHSDFDEQKEAALPVEIECVTPPTPEQLSRISAVIKKKYGVSELTFEIRRNPAVVDGFRLFVGDDNYDFSTMGRIRQLRKSFQSLPKEYDPARIISLFREDIADFSLHTGHQQVGTVLGVGDGIAVISGLYEVAYGEIVLFECGVKGMVEDLRTDGTAGVVLFGDESEVMEGTRVLRTRRTAGIPISNRILGRVIDPLGQPIDGRGEIGAKEYFPIERPAPGIIDRQPVSEPLSTGILSVDALFPIGRGQRELIIGDRQTGKTSLALDTILNQKGKDVVCVYVAIGQKASSVARVADTLEKAGAMAYTVIVSSPANDPAAMQYIAPYAGCAVAEYFMYRGRDTLVVYDDLSKHAVAYRTLSLLLERAPGREAYPGDVFYLHARLLERSAHLSAALGGGSMTALPIVETQAGDVSAYIPTNVISITDGQIFLESELFFAGQRPAVSVGLSVSRVGGAAQTKLMKKAVGSIRLDLSQHREMQVFTRFGGDLDDTTLRELRYGAGLTRLLRQSLHAPLSQAEQVLLLLSAQARLFEEIEPGKVAEARERLLSVFPQRDPGLFLELSHGEYSEKLKENVLALCRALLLEAGFPLPASAKE